MKSFILIATLIFVFSASQGYGETCFDLVRVAADFEAEIARANEFWSAVPASVIARLRPPQSSCVVKSPGRVFVLNVDQFPWPLQNQRTPAAYVYPEQGVLYSPKKLVARAREAGVLSHDAYVGYAVAHEMGHHVQNALGLLATEYTVNGDELQPEHFYRLELMADCLAGFYLTRRHSSPSPFTPVVAALGSDVTTSYYVSEQRVRAQAIYPTAKQRVKWFMLGWVAPDFNWCQTLTPALADLI